MPHSFKKITVLGGGLLGGSIIAALGDRVSTSLWIRRPEVAEAARNGAFPTATNNIQTALEGSELIIFAVPVGAMPSLLAMSLEYDLPEHCLFTDVGSVKSTPHRQLTPLLEGKPQQFIGSHPMAGSEQNGLSAARADLFNNAACLLTNDSQASEENTKKIETFWQHLGCKTSWLDADEHDRAVAKISHLPHVTAAATALTALEAEPAFGQFGGGGLRDTTRVASGNPEMWAEILNENRHPVCKEIRHTIAKLQEILASLESGDQEQIQSWLTQAKIVRDSIRK